MTGSNNEVAFNVITCYRGRFALTPANVHDITTAEYLTDQTTGFFLGDRNYWSPQLAARLADKGIRFLAPYKSAKRETQPWPRWLAHTHYRIATVFSKLIDRSNAKTIWARDTWHLTSRWWRKILAHTLAVFTAQQLGLDSPLRFVELITHKLAHGVQYAYRLNTLRSRRYV